MNLINFIKDFIKEMLRDGGWLVGILMVVVFLWFFWILSA